MSTRFSSFSDTIRFSWWRMMRLSSFQIGSAMGDILVTSIWNRIMITNFGIPAWIVGLLIALRYFMSPLSLWAGHRSDTQKLFGYYRTSYIWLGRGLMVLALPFLGLSVQYLEGDQLSVAGWGSALLSFFLYGIGTLLSGSPFLALVRDSAPAERQGLAISVAETVLIIFFAIAGIGFSLLIEEFTVEIFWRLVLITAGIGGIFWFLGVLGVEKESRPPESRFASDEVPDFGGTLRKIWADSRTRRFFVFLSLATMSAWAHDVILEPFGKDVLDLGIDLTTRLSSIWQSATVLSLVIGSIVWRKRAPEKQSGIAGWGLTLMALGMGLLGVDSYLKGVGILEAGLIIFGLGFGIYTFGGLSLMAVMSSDREAGIYLGLWTISILIFKGLGNFLGGLLRDVFLAVGMSFELSYGLTFGLSALGLALSVVVLSSLDVISFARETGRVTDKTDLQVKGMEL